MKILKFKVKLVSILLMGLCITACCNYRFGIDINIEPKISDGTEPIEITIISKSHFGLVTATLFMDGQTIDLDPDSEMKYTFTPDAPLIAGTRYVYVWARDEMGGCGLGFASYQIREDGKCGDGSINPGERCDGTNLDNQTCQTQGFDSGILACSESCKEFDSSGCYKCGNGIKEPGEYCDDGNKVNGDGCSSECQIEPPPNCGNGNIDENEQCDGTNLDNQTCQTQGFDSGVLACSENCKEFDLSECYKCGNGIVEPGEECDDGNIIKGDDCSEICKIENTPNEPPSVSFAYVSTYETTSDCRISFELEASDLEDGTIPEGKISLESNIDGSLGTGLTYFFDEPSAGIHTITAKATDSQNLTATATVNVTVWPFYFYPREDAAYSPNGDVPCGTKVYFGNFYIMEQGPCGSCIIGVYNRDTDELLYTVDERHSSYGNIVKALAISEYYFATMFHSGSNHGIWVRDLRDGTLIAHFEIDWYWHVMAFDETGKNIVVGESCKAPIYYVTENRLISFQENSGVNLAWLAGQYAWSGCGNPWGSHAGFSSTQGKAKLESDFAYLASKGVKVVRVFILCDCRSCLSYDQQGNIVGPDDYLFADMQALLDTAQAHGLKIIPVLFDYLLANGVSDSLAGISRYNHSDVNQLIQINERAGHRIRPEVKSAMQKVAQAAFLSDEVVLGHPEFLTDPQKKSQLLNNVIRPFIAEFGSNSNIHSWDIMNERKWISQVPSATVGSFIADIAQIILEETSNVLVSEGVNSRCDLAQYLTPAANLVQFHYFDYMEPDCAFDFPADQLNDARPIIIGEVEPTFPDNKLTTAYKNGYKGMLFWSLNGEDGFPFRPIADQYLAWFQK